MTGPEPRWRGIADDIVERVRRGELKAGDQAPSFSEQQASAGVVRDAYRWLKDHGVLRTVQGKGSYVTGSLPHDPPPSTAELAERVADLERRLDEHLRDHP